MNNSIKKELLAHIIETINHQDIECFDDLHYHCFNEDYYIIGYYAAEQWLVKHDVTAWEAIREVLDYELSNFDDVNTKINSEAIVNMYVYVLGEELLNGFDLEQSRVELLADLEEDIKS